MSKISFEDHLEIQNLVSRYCITTDNADADGFMECWVDADRFDGYNSGAFGNAPTWDALYEFEKHHVGPEGMARGKRHQATNLHVEVVGQDKVLVTHDMLVFEVSEEPRLIATGRYDKSVVVRTPKGWRFESRKLSVDEGFFVLTGHRPGTTE